MAVTSAASGIDPEIVSRDAKPGVKGPHLLAPRAGETASLLVDYRELFKLRVTLMVTLTGFAGFYLGSIGGAAARLARDCITKVDVLEYPELGMEAVWKIEVRDFPAFIVVDDKGNDFFQQLK